MPTQSLSNIHQSLGNSIWTWSRVLVSFLAMSVHNTSIPLRGNAYFTACYDLFMYGSSQIEATFHVP
jgi:hypothetical protein